MSAASLYSQPWRPAVQQRVTGQLGDTVVEKSMAQSLHIGYEDPLPNYLLVSSKGNVGYPLKCTLAVVPQFYTILPYAYTTII